MTTSIDTERIDLTGRLADFEASIVSNGFLNAWRTHFLDLVAAHHAAEATSPVLGKRLYDLMQRDPELRRHFDTLPAELGARLQEATGGLVAPVARWESHIHADFVNALRETVRRAAPFPQISEGDGTPMRCVGDPFQNWGRTVANRPALTFIPRTKTGVCNLVKWAATQRNTVRVAGYRHTWSDLYSADDKVLISLLPLGIVENLPAAEPPMDPDDELQGIRIVGTIEEDGVTKALCRIGAATTNEQFRNWCLSSSGGAWQWTVPLNVIMVEITWGGSNAPICHGAGRRNRTLSDLVTSIEFVNAKGELQVVTDPVELHAAAGCFGLLGVVTALTLKLDPMSYAVMTPMKPRLALTVPPPGGLPIPAGVDMSGISEADLEQARVDFVRHCEDDYYTEWFWFPYQQQGWVNCWNNNGRREEATPYPTAIETAIEEAAEYLAELANDGVFKLLSGRLQAELLATGAMVALPENQRIVAPLIDALHFRRGIQNMRVLDMELEIPIPPRADDPNKPDWTVCQKAWWAVIANLLQRSNAPMRIALEMRIMGDSTITMAPQFGNRLGTCSIEVLTNLNVDEADWRAFAQEICDAWDSHTDPDGTPLNVRPHWAKQWGGLTFRQMPVNAYLKTIAYTDRIPEFRRALAAVCRAGGYTLQDIRQRFANPLLTDLLEGLFV